MFGSGYLTLIAGIAMAQGLSDRMAATIERLIYRGTVVPSRVSSESLPEILQTKARTWDHRGGVLLASLIAGIYGVWNGPLETALAIIAGYVVGRVVGRMVCYGFLGRFLRGEGARVIMQPGHPDGAAGLKPLGDFYFSQAMLLAIPIAFLAVWTLLIPVWPYHDYSHWRAPYLTLLVVGLVLEMGAFFLPMWTIHQDMVKEKARLQAEADELGRQIVGLRAKLTGIADAEARSALKDQVELLSRQYEELEHVPTWPVDRSTGRRFTVSNLAMFIPVAVQIIGATGPWRQIAEVMERFLSQP